MVSYVFFNNTLHVIDFCANTLAILLDFFFLSPRFFSWMLVLRMQLLLVKPLEDPKKTTEIILEALQDTGQRGIIDRGWGDLGKSMLFPLCLLLSG